MPETTSTDCPDSDHNQPNIIVPSSSTVDIAVMVGKLTLNNPNGEESDASSDGGGEATETEQPLDSGTSYTIEIKHRNQSPSVNSNSSVVSDGSWTNWDRDQERQRRSRSSSECSDSSSASSDSSPPEVCDVECNGQSKGLENMLKNLNMLRLNVGSQNVTETTEQDVDSNCAKKTTDDLDSESSSDDNQDSEDESGASDTEEQYTQRGPMKLPSTTRVHNGKPYDIPDSSLGSSPTRDEFEVSTENIEFIKRMLEEDPEGTKRKLMDIVTQTNLPSTSSFDTETTSNVVQAPNVATDGPPNYPPTSLSPMDPFGIMRPNPPSIGSISPVSCEYNSQTPSPTTYNGDAADVEDVNGLIGELNDIICSGSPVSELGMRPVNDSIPQWNIDFDSPPKCFPDSVYQPHLQYNNVLGTTTSTSTSTGLVIVNTQPTTSRFEGIRDPMLTGSNDDYAKPKYLARDRILSMNQFGREPVIPTPVLDIDNTRDDPEEKAKLLKSLDIKLSRFTDKFMQLVSLASLRNSASGFLGIEDYEFSIRNADGNTYAMHLLSRSEDVILRRLARLLVALEKMRRAPGSYEAKNISNHDLLYMAAINLGGKHEYITSLVLEKTFKQLGADSEVWTRTYDDLGNTLIHIVIAKGPQYENVLRELLDVRTTGNQTVFSLSAVNKEGKRPWDLAVAADNGRNDYYSKNIRTLLDNYRTPVVASPNFMWNVAPNVQFFR